jgi:hypothetical protein
LLNKLIKYFKRDGDTLVQNHSEILLCRKLVHVRPGFHCHCLRQRFAKATHHPQIRSIDALQVLSYFPHAFCCLLAVCILFGTGGNSACHSLSSEVCFPGIRAGEPIRPMITSVDIFHEAAHLLLHGKREDYIQYFFLAPITKKLYLEFLRVLAGSYFTIFSLLIPFSLMGKISYLPGAVPLELILYKCKCSQF